MFPDFAACLRVSTGCCRPCNVEFEAARRRAWSSEVYEPSPKLLAVCQLQFFYTETLSFSTKDRVCGQLDNIIRYVHPWFLENGHIPLRTPRAHLLTQPPSPVHAVYVFHGSHVAFSGPHTQMSS